jgi:uncharacterized protein DUF6894
MQRYHFHFKWRDDAVFDEEGIELENFEAAYAHACGLVQQVRRRFPAGGADWWIEISNGIDTPTTILPAMVPGANIAKPRA